MERFAPCTTLSLFLKFCICSKCSGISTKKLKMHLHPVHPSCQAHVKIHGGIKAINNSWSPYKEVKNHETFTWNILLMVWNKRKRNLLWHFVKPTIHKYPIVKPLVPQPDTVKLPVSHGKPTLSYTRSAVAISSKKTPNLSYPCSPPATSSQTNTKISNSSSIMATRSEKPPQFLDIGSARA